MTAAARLRRPVAVALLGRPDAAREQLRQALVGCGAEVVFEDDLAATAADALQAHSPQVVLINLEPGLEEDFDHLQPLLDDPQVSVVFNEGEVSSQLAGWDLARWARHLASKVLGGGETTPPRPAGLEALPSLNLQPTPGRPLTPAQQSGELRLETYTLEAVDRAASVPYSEQPAREKPASAAGLDAQSATPVTATELADDLLTLDSSDLDGVDSALRATPAKPEVSGASVPGMADPGGEVDAGPDATVEAAANHLRGAHFGEGTTGTLGDVGAVDGLLPEEVAEADGDALAAPGHEQFEAGGSDPAAAQDFDLQWQGESDATTGLAADSPATLGADFAEAEASDPGFDFDFSIHGDAAAADQGQVPSAAIEQPSDSEHHPDSGDDRFDALERAFGLSPGSTAGFEPEARRMEPASDPDDAADDRPQAAEPVEAFDFDFSSTGNDAEAVEPASGSTDGAGDQRSEAAGHADSGLMLDSTSTAADGGLSDDWSWDEPTAGTSFASASAEDATEVSDAAATGAAFDFQQFDDVAPSQTSGASAASEDGDDEQLAELLASFDAQSATLPTHGTEAVDEFDFSALSLDDFDDAAADSPEAPHPQRAPAPGSAAPGASAHAAEQRPQAQPPEAAAAAAAPEASPPSLSGLSLMPMDAELPVASKPVAAPAFDFSKLELSLEPIEGEETESEAPTKVAMPSSPAAAQVRDDGAQHRSTATAASDVGDPAPADSAGADGEQLPMAVASSNGMPDWLDEPAPQQLAPADDAVQLQRIVVLGASIGGPDALRSFLAGIPADFPALFVLAQHLENGFFERLAQQLQKGCKLPVRVPQSGETARHGEVLVVTSSDRLLLARDGAVDLLPITEPSHYRPCIDDVLCDVADRFGASATAIIFSGMAADAIEGAAHLASVGGEVWVQDPESCVVSSMVDGAQARGIVEFVGSPRELADHCVERYG